MRTLFIIVTVIIVFIAGVVSQLPLAFVVAPLGQVVDLGEVRGTIWDGEIRDIRVNGQPVGDAAVKLKFLPLLQGRGEGELSFSGSGLEGSGTASFDGDLIVLEDAAGQADLARFGLVDAFDQTLRGTVDAEIERLAFSLEEGCREARLTAETDALSRSLGVYADRGFLMAGTGYCDGDVLVLPLEGEGDEAALRAELRLDKRGRYLSRLAVEPKVEELEFVLRGYGFEERDGVFVIERGGLLEANL